METFTFEMPSAASITPLNFLINISLCAVASFILRNAYLALSRSLTGRHHIGHIIPVLSLVTFLVIMIVKSSLALSLGLVGALSIVRFRTPVKEPEELVVLFLAIGLGLGYGAGLPIVTTSTFVFILAVFMFFGRRSKLPSSTSFNLIVEWSNEKCKLANVIEEVGKMSKQLELVKYSSTKTIHSVYLRIGADDVSEIENIENNLRAFGNDLTVVFSESRPML